MIEGIENNGENVKKLKDLEVLLDFKALELLNT